MVGPGVGPGAGEPDGHPGPWDAGLQPERTSLAWQRTGLALVVASLVAVRDSGVPGGGPPTGPHLVTLLLGVAAAVCGLLVVRASRTGLDRRVAALRAGHPLPPADAAPVAVAGTVLLAAAALGVLLV